MGQLRAENISKKFGSEQIIEGINLSLEEGEIVSVLGVSGAGKTTLFNVLSGLDKPDSGSVFLDGRNITGKPGEISYMLQKDLLLPYYTTLKNVALPLIIRGEKKKTAFEKAEELFPFFGLVGTERKYPHQLSGGMRQRAAFLRTYLSSKGVVLLDEPFSALDTITKNAVHQWYLGIMKEIRISTLFITHDIDEAILLSDRICILSGKPGRITGEIKVDLPKPRTKELTFTPEFLEYKKLISQKITESQ
ncbi:MAG: ABC transporter ATP-binding protein [Acutalibacteraceae bacterium]|nr:ABC transporter ATP-binding protein [Acutalibacteraceae bacterium]